MIDVLGELVGVMGAKLCKGCQQKIYINLSSPEEEDLLERLLRRRPRRSKIGRQARPQFVLYNMEEFRQVKDHESVRRLLVRIPQWVSQRPTDGYIEYWYYFHQDGLLLTLSRKLYPAARARLPWPLLHTATPEILQSFANVVNRIAHCEVLAVLSTMDREPYGRQERSRISVPPRC